MSSSQLNMRKFTIEKLSDTNYRIWKARLELLFKYNKLWDIISGSSTKPEKGEELEDYEEKDLCARMEILMHVSDGTGETLRKMETAHEMWKHLQTIYEPKNDAQQAHTLQALVNYKMNDEQPVGEFLLIWQKKLDDVLTSGLEIHDKLQKIRTPSWRSSSLVVHF